MGVDRHAPYIKHFWAVLQEFTPHQRRQFVKFAYAQERLPSTDGEFDSYPKTRMLIKRSRCVHAAVCDRMLVYASQ